MSREELSNYNRAQCEAITADYTQQAQEGDDFNSYAVAWIVANAEAFQAAYIRNY